MAQFTAPFLGMVPERKMTNNELIRAIRQNIAEEQGATFLYNAIADATDNEAAKAVLNDVANDERVHAAQFGRLLQMFTGDEGEFILKGNNETDRLTAGVRNSFNTSPKFNPLDPLGLLEPARRDIERLLAPVQRMMIGSNAGGK